MPRKKSYLTVTDQFCYVCRGNPGVLVKVKQNRRKLELTEERQKHLIGLAPFDLEPDYQERNERIYRIVGSDRTTGSAPV